LYKGLSAMLDERWRWAILVGLVMEFGLVF
jgi:hypothetical protein